MKPFSLVSHDVEKHLHVDTQQILIPASGEISEDSVLHSKSMIYVWDLQLSLLTVRLNKHHSLLLCGIIAFVKRAERISNY